METGPKSHKLQNEGYRLNRTMQYGNLDEVFKMCFPCRV